MQSGWLDYFDNDGFIFVFGGGGGDEVRTTPLSRTILAGSNSMQDALNAFNISTLPEAEYWHPIKTFRRVQNFTLTFLSPAYSLRDMEQILVS